MSLDYQRDTAKSLVPGKRTGDLPNGVGAIFCGSSLHMPEISMAPLVSHPREGHSQEKSEFYPG
jgi:hypothetical protein